MNGLDRYRDLVDDPAAFLDAARRPLPTVVWANAPRVSPGRLEELLRSPPREPALRGEAMPFTPLPWLAGAYRFPADVRPGNRFEFATGLYHVQEEVSLLPVTLLAPRPGERVLDLCAAPGGKTAQLAVAVGRTGTVVANDKYVGRLSLLRRSLDRLGIAHCVTTQYDAAGYPAEAGLFDRVLADVPCSCEGTTRKMPHLPHDPDTLPPGHLADLQTAILRRAVELCRPGGTIAYATCTYAPEENECVVDDVLRRYEGSLRVVPARVPGFRSAPGLTHWQGRRLDPSLEGCLRAWPHLQDTGGFFVALLEKTAPTGSRKEGRPEGSVALADVTTVLTATEAQALRQRLHDYHHFQDLVESPLAESPNHSAPTDPLADLDFFSPNNRYLAATPPTLRPPKMPHPHTLGLAFVRHGTTDPRLASPAALDLAPLATTHVADLTATQADAFLHRKTLHGIHPTQLHHTTTGFTLLRHRSIGLGTGILQPGPDAQSDATASSLFPRAWALADGRGAFEIT